MTKAQSRAVFLRHIDVATRRGEALPDADWADRHDHLLGSAVAFVGACEMPENLGPYAPDDSPIALPGHLLPLVPLRCAALATAAGDPELSAYLMNQYVHERAELVRMGAAAPTEVAARYRMEV